MGVFYEEIPKSMFEWILAQKVFWIATAPLSGNGHVNVSPKGGQYFGLLNERQFWYMDLTGSGNETISHLWERGNGRITVMFNAFEGGPRILRLWGHGNVLENGTKQFSDFITEHSVETIPGTRSIIIVDIHQVGSSCGFSVPFYDFKEFRPTLNDHFAKKDRKYREGKEEESMDRYWAYKNAWSMDGMPGMHRALVAGKEHSVAPIKKMVGPLAPTKYQTEYGFTARQMFLLALVSFLIGLAVAVYGSVLARTVLSGVKSPDVDIKVVNLSHVPVLEGLTGLWSRR